MRLGLHSLSMLLVRSNSDDMIPVSNLRLTFPLTGRAEGAIASLSSYNTGPSFYYFPRSVSIRLLNSYNRLTRDYTFVCLTISVFNVTPSHLPKQYVGLSCVPTDILRD